MCARKFAPDGKLRPQLVQWLAVFTFSEISICRIFRWAEVGKKPETRGFLGYWTGASPPIKAAGLSAPSYVTSDGLMSSSSWYISAKNCPLASDTDVYKRITSATSDGCFWRTKNIFADKYLSEELRLKYTKLLAGLLYFTVSKLAPWVKIY